MSSRSFEPTIREICVSTFSESRREMTPEKTGLSPRLDRLIGIRAVVFDVYGTLFTSASGDIGVSRQSERLEPFAAAMDSLGCDPVGVSIRSVAEMFYGAIERDHKRRRALGAERPEVCIEEIWREIETALGCDSAPDDLSHYRAAVAYESRANPVAPMPGALEAVHLVRRRGLQTGIVSNAQFFTRYLFDAYLGARIEELGFEESLCVWSYVVGESKPSVRIFAPLLEALSEKGVKPAEVLYVGNDMLNDVYTASAAGCRTVLFAGDTRSLRMREDRPECADLNPDAIITSWEQLDSLL